MKLMASLASSLGWATMKDLVKWVGQKKPDQELIFETRSKSKKVLMDVLNHFAMPKQNQNGDFQLFWPLLILDQWEASIL